jgi:hypothetical protein
MIKSGSYLQPWSSEWARSSVLLAAWLLFGGVAAAQDRPATAPKPELSFPVATAVPRVTFPPVSNFEQKDAAPPSKDLSVLAYNPAPNAADLWTSRCDCASRKAAHMDKYCEERQQLTLPRRPLSFDPHMNSFIIRLLHSDFRLESV